MRRTTQADDDSTETQTARDVYGVIDPTTDVDSREDWDPVLEPEGFTPEAADDGRSYHVAAWDGGVSDLTSTVEEIYDTSEGAPAVLVYNSNQGGVQVFEGTVVTLNERVVTIEADDGTTRTARSSDMKGRREAVESDTGRHIGTMLDVRLTRPWDALAKFYGFPEGVEEVYEVVAVYPNDPEEVVAVEPTREQANETRREWTPEYGQDEPLGMTVRKLTDDDALAHEDDESDDDDDDDDDPEVRTDGGEVEERTTPVDGGVIHEVAQGYAMGAGALKGALEGVSTSAELSALKAPLRDAATEALEQHGAGRRQAVRDEWHGETVWSDEFGQAVTVEEVHPPTADEVLDDVVAVTVRLDDSSHPDDDRYVETTDLSTLVTESADPEDLNVGDLYALPDGTALLIEGVAPADEAPDSARDGPLYQAQVQEGDGPDETHLYGPHNIRYAIDAGAVYAGSTVVHERRPFWCDWCCYPHQDDERRDDPLLDGEVCSYGCAQELQRSKLRERLDDDDDRQIMTDGGQDVRATAEVDDSADDPEEWEVLPPTLTVRGEVPQAVREAVEAALDAEPNACNDPTVGVPDNEFHGAYLTASYNEKPVSTGDGPEDFAWVAPYRYREDFDAALREALPDGWAFEHANGHRTDFYQG